MSFVNVSVETEKQVFEAGTAGGSWGFWINNIFGELVAGPKTTPNKSIIFQVKEGGFNGEQLVAFAVRLDRDGNRLGSRRFKLFILDELSTKLVVDEIEYDDSKHSNLFGSEILPIM